VPQRPRHRARRLPLGEPGSLAAAASVSSQETARPGPGTRRLARLDGAWTARRRPRRPAPAARPRSPRARTADGQRPAGSRGARARPAPEPQASAPPRSPRAASQGQPSSARPPPRGAAWPGCRRLAAAWGAKGSGRGNRDADRPSASSARARPAPAPACRRSQHRKPSGPRPRSPAIRPPGVLASPHRGQPAGQAGGRSKQGRPPQQEEDRHSESVTGARCRRRCRR